MKKLKQILKDKLTEKQLALVPTSFDIVGDIAIFNNFPKELAKKEKIIAQKVMELNKNIKVVTKKSKSYSGRLRTPKIKIITGENRKQTIHKELGCSFRLDIEKCYFSTRLQNERLRIAKKVKKGELVLVMFSGIAPIPIVISKKTKAKEIIGVELNKIAHKYAQENLKLNKVNNVKLYNGDVKTVVPKLKKKFNRVIVPFPKDSQKYLNLATKKLKPKGAIHLYLFAEKANFKNTIKEYKKQFKKVKLTKAGHFGPKIYRICLDLQK